MTMLFSTFNLLDIVGNPWKWFNPFLVDVSISYFLNTPENLRFSGVFRGYKMGTLTRNKLISICIMFFKFFDFKQYKILALSFFEFLFSVRKFEPVPLLELLSQMNLKIRKCLITKPVWKSVKWSNVETSYNDYMNPKITEKFWSNSFVLQVKRSDDYEVLFPSTE